MQVLITSQTPVHLYRRTHKIKLWPMWISKITSKTTTKLHQHYHIHSCFIVYRHFSLLNFICQMAREIFKIKKSLPPLVGVEPPTHGLWGQNCTTRPTRLVRLKCIKDCAQQACPTRCILAMDSGICQFGKKSNLGISLDILQGARKSSR